MGYDSVVGVSRLAQLQQPLLVHQSNYAIIECPTFSSRCSSISGTPCAPAVPGRAGPAVPGRACGSAVPGRTHWST